MSLIVLAAAMALSGAMPQTAPAVDTAAQQAPETAQQLGGYAPTTPLFSGPVTPTTQVEFVPNPETPTQAFPPPAPLKEYPVCKKGQYDQCRQLHGNGK